VVLKSEGGEGGSIKRSLDDFSSLMDSLLKCLIVDYSKEFWENRMSITPTNVHLSKG